MRVLVSQIGCVYQALIHNEEFYIELSCSSYVGESKIWLNHVIPNVPCDALHMCIIYHDYLAFRFVYNYLHLRSVSAEPLPSESQQLASLHGPNSRVHWLDYWGDIQAVRHIPLHLDDLILIEGQYGFAHNSWLSRI